mmetsp:Transcript_45919/g.103015  ORF Transcript_45919/g.103015 Transcript_45919/m.103015 type:complete len:378 (+) Transcript_45919:96-1229(+)
MSCASIDPHSAAASEASPGQASEGCQALRNDEEEDRLSTAAPSLCDDREDATTRWADVAEADNVDFHCNFLSAAKAPNSRRWADLLDSDEEEDQAQSSSMPPRDSQSHAKATAPAAKPRWADLAEEPEDEPQETTASSSNAVTQGSQSSEEEEGSWNNKSWNWWNNWEWEDSSASNAAHSGYRKTQWRSTGESSYQAKAARYAEAAVDSFNKGQRRHGSWTAAGGSWQYYEKPAQTPKGKGKGKTGGKATGKGSSGSKCQCQYIIGIEEEARFRVCRRLLGQKGQHMKDIATNTGAKLRLRGRGSKFLEGPEQKESSDPLMLCVSVPDPASYEEAKHLVSSLLEDIYAQYREFQQSEGLKPKNLKVNLHEGPRPGSY